MTKKQNNLNVQCIVRKDISSRFIVENAPKLLYISKMSPTASLHPRVMHAHKDYMEIVLIYSGQSDFHIHNKKYCVKESDLMIYQPNVVHDENTGEHSTVGSYCIALQGVKLENLPPNHLIPCDTTPIFNTSTYFNELVNICELMYNTLASGDIGCEITSQYLMLAFIEKVITIIETSQNPNIEYNEEQHILGLKIKKYIDENYMEQLTLQSIANKMYISTHYLSHVFKNSIGYSPMQYLLRRRIGEAQTLLISTDYSITQISEMVGYDTQSYFNLQFTKNVGISPKKYRTNYIVDNEK